MLALKFLQKLKKSRFWAVTALILLWSCTVATPTFAQSFSLLHSFTGGTDGSGPSEGLVLDSAGNLYGTTQSGGTGNCTQNGWSGCGTVFKVTNQGTETVLYSFQGGSDGEYPWGGLALGDKNRLFGTTPNGGLGFGVVFSLDESGTEHIVHRFTGKTDGGYPYGGLTLDSTGHLYGTSTSGGDLKCGYKGQGCGTLFELDLSKEAVVHRFAGTPSDGYYAGYGAVLFDSAGNLYGTTGEGGPWNYGTVYKIDPSGKYTVLYSFSGGSDGCEPLGNLAVDENGNLYGAASACGDFGEGTIFRVSSTGSLFVLYTFGSQGVEGGQAPFGGVTRDSNGDLYGTTLLGGGCSFDESGCGTIFKLTQDGSMTILHSFNGYTDGTNPFGPVTLDALGNLYGTTSSGPGGNGAGTVWKIAP
jgi:uncharacterized repeat protein (TIGR03803 family)